TAHRLVEGRDLVIEVVATLVEAPGVQSQGVLHKISIDLLDTRSASGRLALLQQVEKTPGVSVGIADDGVGGQLVELKIAQRFFLSTAKELLELVLGQRLEHIHLRARQQGGVDFKGRVL